MGRRRLPITKYFTAAVIVMVLGVWVQTATAATSRAGVTLSISKSHVATAAGQNFNPGKTVAVTFTAGKFVKTLSSIVQANGRFRVSTAIPSNYSGTVSVVAKQLSSTGTSGQAAVGVQFHGMWSDYSDVQRAQVLDLMKAAGLTWVRIDVSYTSSFAQVDPVINAAHQRGFKILVTLWNSDDKATLPGNEFATQARAFSAHYKGSVQAWEPWNEPDDVGWSGAQYAGVLKSVYPAFKAGDPTAAVVFSGTIGENDQWIAAAYAAGAKGSFDIMATHPYQAVANEPPDAPDKGDKYRLTHVSAVRNLMIKNGDSKKPIWFTEFGWSSHANTGTEENWQRGVTEQQQGQYFVKTVQLVRSQYPYVTNMFWYTDRNIQNEDVQNNNFGLLTYDLKPKPAYVAIKSLLVK